MFHISLHQIILFRKNGFKKLELFFFIYYFIIILIIIQSQLIITFNRIHRNHHYNTIILFFIFSFYICRLSGSQGQLTPPELLTLFMKEHNPTL